MRSVIHILTVAFCFNVPFYIWPFHTFYFNDFCGCSTVFPMTVYATCKYNCASYHSYHVPFSGFLQFLTEIKCLSFFPICFLSVSLRVPCTSAFQFEIFSDLLCEVSGTSLVHRKI